MKTISAHFKGSAKTYTFNTELDVKTGDKIRSEQYKDAIIIVSNPNLGNYKYVNTKNGEIVNELLSNCVEIREITGKIE